MTNVVVGHTKRTIGVTIIVIAGALGGFVGGQIYQEKDIAQKNFKKGHYTCVGVITLALLLTLILRFALVAINRKRAGYKNINENGIEDARESAQEANDNGDETDYNPKFIYRY